MSITFQNLTLLSSGKVPTASYPVRSPSHDEAGSATIFLRRLVTSKHLAANGALFFCPCLRVIKALSGTILKFLTFCQERFITMLAGFCIFYTCGFYFAFSAAIFTVFTGHKQPIANRTGFWRICDYRLSKTFPRAIYGAFRMIFDNKLLSALRTQFLLFNIRFSFPIIIIAFSAAILVVVACRDYTVTYVASFFNHESSPLIAFDNRSVGNLQRLRLLYR